MNKTNTTVCVRLLGCALLMLAMAGCTQGVSLTPTSNAVVVKVVANASVGAWVEKAAEAFNGRQRVAAGRPIYATVTRVEAGDAIAGMATLNPDIWMPDDAAWAELAATRGFSGFVGGCVTTVRSPLVLAVNRSLAESLGYPARSLGWLDLSSLAGDAGAWRYYTGGQFGPSLRMGHAHPSVSGSGASTLLAVVQAARSTAAVVTAADIRSPLAQASVAAFEGGVTIFGKNASEVAIALDARGITYLGAAAVYESDVFALGKDTEIVPVYPFEGTFVASHPACVNSGADAQQKEAALAFQSYLTQPAAQALARELGFRPQTSDPKAAPVLAAARGFDLSQPKIEFSAPPANLEAVQSVWRASRKPINLVMVLDISGSMAGEKMRSMQRAAANFAAQLSKGDRLTVLAFSTAVSVVHGPVIVQTDADRNTARNAINALIANGGTALYDGVGEASDLIRKDTSSQRSNVIVLLSDGQDTGSKKYRNDAALLERIRRDNTTTVSIAYGKDADVSTMQRLAREGNGDYYAGSEADIAAIYAEISTAFGGSAGIGR